jgi:hypothetical protein
MKTLLLTILLLSFGQAQAQATSAVFLHGNKLLERCEAHVNDTNVAKGAACMGYLEGIDDVHDTFTIWKEMDKQWCTPDKINSDQLVRVMVKYLQEHPEQLHLAASSLVPHALHAAFPCEEGETI